MKITLINKADTGGGAAVAGHRLFNALTEAGADVTLLVQHRSVPQIKVAEVANSTVKKAIATANFLGERLPFILKEKDPSVRFAFSTANTGSSIAHHPDVLAADILHFHWTNGGFLSQKNLEELFSLNKPIVWTLHDLWAFTGGCHYSAGCDHFQHSCGNCPFLKHPHARDISRSGWLKKQALYTLPANISFVTCSNWLKEVAKESSLLAQRPVHAIPNPIDVSVFFPQDKQASREKWNLAPNQKIILFGAANINDKRKGIVYLTAALEKLRETYPAEAIRILIFGKNRSFDTTQLPFPVTSMPLIRDNLALSSLYAAADVFLLPSVEDNLPNMVMEAMACGTPAVAFQTGGLPDLVDHKVNGYLAAFRDANDLAAGLAWALHDEQAAAGKNARQKVLDTFTNAAVAKAYLQLYQQLMNGTAS